MTNNIAIAYNTVVENARTGGGNDVLGGNSAANRLEGLAEHVCATITGHFRAPWVRVSVAKLGHIRNVRKVGVTLERRREPAA